MAVHGHVRHDGRCREPTSTQIVRWRWRPVRVVSVHTAVVVVVVVVVSVPGHVGFMGIQRIHVVVMMSVGWNFGTVAGTHQMSRTERRSSTEELDCVSLGRRLVRVRRHRCVGMAHRRRRYRVLRHRSQRGRGLRQGCRGRRQMRGRPRIYTADHRGHGRDGLLLLWLLLLLLLLGWSFWTMKRMNINKRVTILKERSLAIPDPVSPEFLLLSLTLEPFGLRFRCWMTSFFIVIGRLMLCSL